MNNFDPKKFKIIFEAIRRAVKCPNCNGGFVERDIEMIAGDKDAYFVKLSCSKCGLNLVASLVNVSERKNIPSISDIDLLFEAQTLKHGKKISTDDVIDAHNFLSSFEGSLK